MIASHLIMFERFFQFGQWLGFVLQSQLVDTSALFKVTTRFQSFGPVDVEARQVVKVTGAVELLKPFGTVFSQIQVTQIHLQQTWVRVVTWQIANLLKTLNKGEKVVVLWWKIAVKGRKHLKYLFQNSEQISFFASFGVILFEPVDVLGPLLQWVLAFISHD